MRLRAQSLTVRASDRTLMSGFDLSVSPGASVAVMGPSGSGKTTLLNCLCGIRRPEAGNIFIDDVDITQINTTDRARFRLRHMGMVFQSGELVPELTVVDNVMLPMLVDGIREGEAVRPARHILDRLGVSALADRYPESLSGGETQRVGVARALVRSPRVVFADEPTGALDDDNATTVVRLLIEAATEGGASVVIVTHDHCVAAQTDAIRSLTLPQTKMEPELSKVPMIAEAS